MKKFAIVLSLILVVGCFAGIAPKAASAEVIEWDFGAMTNGIIESVGLETNKIIPEEGDPHTFEEFTFWMGYGTLDPDDYSNTTWVNVTNFENNSGMPFASDSGTGSTYNCGFQRTGRTHQPWQWRASTKLGQTFIRITAKSNFYLNVWNPTITDQWAFSMIVTQWAIDPENTMVKMKEARVNNTSDANKYFTGIHMKAGDTLLLVLTDGGHNPGTNQVLPLFALDVDAYDESKRPDYALVKEVKAYQLEKIAELEDYVASKDSEIYTASRYSSMGDIVTKAAVEIDACLNKADIDVIVSNTKADIDAVPTKAQEADYLKNYGEEKKAELEAEFPEANIDAKLWPQVSELLNKAYDAIAAAKNVANVNVAVSGARAQIEQLLASAEAEKGCSSSKQADAGIVLGGLAAAIVVLGKKKEH